MYKKLHRYFTQKGATMLEMCLNYYGIYDNLHFSLSLHKLEQLAFQQHSCGYSYSLSPTFSMSYFEIKNLLNIYQDSNYEHTVHEIFRYAAFFGLISHVIISPFHIEWKYNCFHQRDLFFSKMRLEIREQKKISSYF